MAGNAMLVIFLSDVTVSALLMAFDRYLTSASVFPDQTGATA